MQRELAQQAVMVRSGARPVRLRAMVGVARLVGKHFHSCGEDTSPLAESGTFSEWSWSKVWDGEGVTSLAVLPKKVSSRSEGGSPRYCVVSSLFVPCTITRPPCQGHCSARESRGGKHDG